MHKIISLTIPRKTLCSGSAFHTLQLCHYEVSEVTRQSADCLEQNVQSFTSYCFSKVPPQNCHYVQLPSDLTAPQPNPTPPHPNPTPYHPPQNKSLRQCTRFNASGRETRIAIHWPVVVVVFSPLCVVDCPVLSTPESVKVSGRQRRRVV